MKEKHVLKPESTGRKIPPTPIGLLENESNMIAKHKLVLFPNKTNHQWYVGTHTAKQFGKLDNNNLFDGLGNVVLEDLATLDPLEVT